MEKSKEKKQIEIIDGAHSNKSLKPITNARRRAERGAILGPKCSPLYQKSHHSWA